MRGARQIPTLKKIFRRIPRRVKIIAGPLLGSLIGLSGGIPGMIIGILLGYLVQELFGQFHSDKEALKYFENPGRPDFYEGEPGLAAFCALGILVVARRTDASPFPSPAPVTDGDAAAGEVSRKAAALFPGGRADSSLTGYFCRLAWSRRRRLNPDLLAESLMARRASQKDLPDLGRALCGLAWGEKSLDLARSIRAVLDPNYHPGAEETARPKEEEPDPWQVLGLAPGTPVKEVKSRFRRLAIRLHPDSLRDEDGPQRETAAVAFIALEEAYHKIVGREKRE
jgi:hypothetical protein